jgi:ABC-type transport system involved in multi-copper enzyme maturation permease subunit
MTGQLASELLKLRTTRTVAAVALTAAALTALGAGIEGFSPTLSDLTDEAEQRSIFSAAGSTAVLFSTIAGLLMVTSEFRYGTIRPTLLFEPRRRLVLSAKLAAAALVGAGLAAVSEAIAFGAGSAILSAREVDVALTGAHVAGLIVGPIVAAALGAMLGVAIGTLIRNQAAAIVAVVAYAFAIDAVLFGAAPSVGRYLPGKAGDALSGLPVDDLLTPATGGVVLALWTLAFTAAALVRNDRSDV